MKLVVNGARKARLAPAHNRLSSTTNRKAAHSAFVFNFARATFPARNSHPRFARYLLKWKRRTLAPAQPSPDLRLHSWLLCFLPGRLSICDGVEMIPP